MLLWLLACLHAEKAANEFHDDAGYLITEVRNQHCVRNGRCSVWDTGYHNEGPRAVALGRNVPTHDGGRRGKRLAKYGLDKDFDGVVAMVAEDNPLFVQLVSNGCTHRYACTIYFEGDSVFIGQHGVQVEIVSLDE